MHHTLRHEESSLLTDQLDTAIADQYNALISQARLLFEAGDFPAACRAAEQAVSCSPMQPDAYNLLGLLEELARRRVDAQRLYRIALELDPGHEPARHNLHRSVQAPGESAGGMRW